MARVKFPHQTVSDPEAQRNFEFLQSVDLGGWYFSGAGKTTVVDGNFAVAPTDGTLAVHYDTTAAKTYVSVRANGVWHVMAGPI